MNLDSFLLPHHSWTFGNCEASLYTAEIWLIAAFYWMFRLHCFIHDQIMIVPLLTCSLQRLPVIHLFNARYKEQIGDTSAAHAAFPESYIDSDSRFIEKVTFKANMERRLVCNQFLFFYVYHLEKSFTYVSSIFGVISHICHSFA